MRQSKSMILGCAGPVLGADEKSLYRDEQPWGFILFARNLSEPQQIRDLVAEMRDCVGRPDAPVLIDQEGGRVQRIRPPHVEAYPPAARLGEIYAADRGAGLRAAWLMSRLHAFDLTRLGITVDCLPVLDVLIEGATQAIGNRSYGSDPAMVTALGTAAAEGLKAGGMLPVMKHMPGHGRAMADSHHDLPVVSASRADLEAQDFAPFRALRHELMGMSAHILFTEIDAGRPATTSPVVIEEIIRGHIGFDGLLLSDDSSMNALKGTIGERAADILAGGCDIVLHCNGLMEEMKAVVERVPELAGRSLERAKAVEAAFPAADDTNEEAARAEFRALLGEV